MMPHHSIYLLQLTGKVCGAGVRRVVVVDQSYNFHLIPLCFKYKKVCEEGAGGGDRPVGCWNVVEKCLTAV